MTKSKTSLLILLLACSAFSVHAQQKPWITTWATSPMSLGDDADEPLLKLEGQTIRERIRISAGGTRLILRFTNEFGTAPLTIGAATVALATTNDQLPAAHNKIDAHSLHPLTFAGSSSITIPAGAPALSDPIDLPLATGAELAISIYFPNRVLTPTGHALALKQTLVSAKGDFTQTVDFPTSATSDSSIALSAAIVPATQNSHLIVALGDSITDGDGSTPEADHNWPADFSRRLAATPATAEYAVANEGIAGNRLLADAYGASLLSRFDRDVLSQPGLTHIVLLAGINDISFPGARLGTRLLAEPASAPTTDQIIAAYRQLIARAHAHGIKIIGATLTPFEGVQLDGYYSPAKDAQRQQINQWIRTSAAYDAILDLDALLRDPAHPTRINPLYDSGDHLHPGDKGYQLIADSIDLALFH
jgi:lysophospholipase L1-like esterase